MTLYLIFNKYKYKLNIMTPFDIFIFTSPIIYNISLFITKILFKIEM